MKRKAYIKIACTAAMFLCAVVMIVMSSYAWLTASTSPVAESIQVAVGGGSTILLAPDMVDGNGVHYPGAFSASLDLSDLLDTTAHSGLTPVSTADGVNWYLPAYYTAEDPEVQSGTAKAGDLRPYDHFLQDDTLTYADLPADDDRAAEGHYLYADFWVVSPGSRYELRVSTGSDASGAGSYAVDLPQVTESEDGTFLMTDPVHPASESLRVGFLVNQNEAADSETAYAQSDTHDRRYTTLLGGYQEPGERVDPRFSYNTFHIYEPNGSGHSSAAAADGDYVITYPLGWNGSGVAGVSVGDRLSVQLRSRWTEDTVADVFAASVQQASNGDTQPTAADVQAQLYKNLSGRSDYVTKGKFVQNTGALYARTGEEHTASWVTLAMLATGGANEDGSIVTLERNTPQRIRMFVWLEGQDADCVSGSDVGKLAMRIELAGSTVE